jgi:hypothetical protein
MFYLFFFVTLAVAPAPVTTLLTMGEEPSLLAVRTLDRRPLGWPSGFV